MFLKVEDIDTYYDATHILFGVSLEVAEGETVSVLGRNGVGKTTLLRSIIGLTPPRKGKIYFQDRRISGRQPFQIARQGVGFVPEDRDIFSNLSVRENLEMGMQKNSDRNGWNLDKIYTLFPILKERRNQWGGTLSGGEQQMLTIARTLMGNPSLLLLDELSEGLAPLVVRAIKEQILLIQKEGVTILISEQDSSFVLDVSSRSYILEKGHVCWHGPSQELRDDPTILDRYLGV
ncbi:MAG: ABC transporter ATP-binding protein [Desulfarculus sp.]|nr:ABC transporter ATP-binding protein [Pseudomonadota bacterium]MBV1716400.1 ABC transporter ATP-binding protein [Desulfarculus sp.]MBU4573422.1 ABC transporter ATP-binding protein [Pseudomonadota bacterium]MBU4598549.1 ABC transporter ATP-binding protein [Pseudomonadota bacterium]MBV1736884.1 ABC transporter ATP-binding protein [Desulfarculus sp.]